MTALTTPKTWGSEPLVSSDMNTYIRDNQLYFADRPGAYYDVTANLSTSSTSFVDIDATNLSLTITPSTALVLVAFTGTFESGSAMDFFFDMLKDGVSIGGTEGVAGAYHPAASSPLTVSWRSFVAVTAGVSVTFKMQWKNEFAVANNWLGSTNTPGQFSVKDAT